MWCACADAVRDTVGKCGSKPHWGSARFTPCDTPRSYRLRRPHRAAAPALAVAPSPQPVKTWRPIALSREKGEIVHTRLLRQNANNQRTVDPSCSARAARSFARVAHARRPRRPGGRAVSTPPTVTDTRFITYVTDTTQTLLGTGHSFLQRAIRARANTDRSTLDSQLLLDCN